MGYVSYAFSFSDFFASIFMIGCSAWITPKRMIKPSDLFLLSYSLIVLLSCAMFHAVTGVMNSIEALFLYLILLLPVLALLGLRRLRLPTQSHGKIDPALIYVLLFSLILVAIALGAGTETNAAFDWDSMYERRMAGRDEIGKRTVLAYLLSASFNGFLPFLAFIVFLHRNIFLMLASVVLSFFAFWLLGLKAPFLFVILLGGLGYVFSRGWALHLPFVALALFVTLVLVALIEIYTGRDSYLAEFFVRRIFVVQGALQSYFFDAVQRQFSSDLYSAIFGIDSSDFSAITYFIGAQYVKGDAVNANTSAFVHALASSGVLGYLLAVGFVGIFFTYADRLFLKGGQNGLFAVAAIYALLLTEQAYLTALTSSGVAVLAVLAILMKSNSKPPPMQRLLEGVQ